MKRKIWGVILANVLLFLSACSVTGIEEEKLRDLDFTVVAEEAVPEELLAEFDEAKEGPVKLTYTDQGYLYILESYGVQETSGYSIKVKELYETENAIYLETELLGPDKLEKVIEEETHPFLVVKIEYNDKYVIFD